MNRKMTIGTGTVEQLKEFQATCPEGPLKEMLTRIAEVPEAYSKTDSILAEFRKTLLQGKKYTPTEKDALCTSLEKVMEILRMEGSDGMLDSYLHGISL